MTPFPTDQSNQYFQLAARFVNETNRDIFLTGKAGTGKTTFLRYIKENCKKKMAIVAPTGVAAINAGGTTLHSFFQLPFGGFIPDPSHHFSGPNGNFNTPLSLFRQLRINNAKRMLFRELELLVIDEVSMLRVDLLDELDLILRHFRRQPHSPFGGVQMLYIGDLFQLPPVINTEEWSVLKAYYKSPFFFDALVLQCCPPLYLELKKIYRQQDAAFIGILNNVRNNAATEEDLARLHQHYLPGYEQSADEKIITLTTHNAKADAINQNRLNQLPGKLHQFTGVIKGEFNDKVLPADMQLHLKEGAQVMFVKNDKGEGRRYYNGKIAIVSNISKDKIIINFPGETREMELEKEIWKNIRYHYSKEDDKINEEELGSYTQYPIRLAWAITIHKSQGLTFDKAIIDAGASFAAGQVYVALSRLTSINGLILFSKINAGCINTDSRVLEFTRLEKGSGQLNEELEKEQIKYICRSLLQSFDWNNFTEQLKEHYEEYELRKIPNKNACIAWAKKVLDFALQQQEMADRFIKQLEYLLAAGTDTNYLHLNDRVTAAKGYFLNGLDQLADSLKQHTKEVGSKSKVKNYQKALQEVGLLVQKKKSQLARAALITAGLAKGDNAVQLMEQLEAQKKSGPVTANEFIAAGPAKLEKGETYRITLQMFKEGKDIAAIARDRELAVSTIESHLARFVKTGEIEIEQIVPKQKIAAILSALDGAGDVAPAIIKQQLGDDFSYGEIRAVMNKKELTESTSNL